MGVTGRWMVRLQNRIWRKSPSARSIVSKHYVSRPIADDASVRAEVAEYQLLLKELKSHATTSEVMAAVKIQSAFRAHLARRAFRALRSLVRLQAIVRGAYVRKQSKMTLRCMHGLVQLQVRVRARQLLNRYGSGRSET